MVSIGSQFSTGDQDRKIRERFLRTRRCQDPNCPASSIPTSTQKSSRDKASTSTIDSEDFVAGCRFNGDAYGTTVFTCRICGWKTSFQYDDASDVYYYETRSFDLKRPKTPPPPPHPWADVDVERFWVEGGVDPRVRSKLRAAGVVDGVTMAEMGRERLVRALEGLGGGREEEEVQALLDAVERKCEELCKKA